MENKEPTCEYPYPFSSLKSESRVRWRRYKRLFLGLIVMHVLTACTEINTKGSPDSFDETLSDFTGEVSTIPEVLDYMERFRALPVNQQRQVFKAINNLAEETPQSASQVKLALLLSLPDTPFSNDDRAQSLLVNYLDTGKFGLLNNQSQQLARLLLEMLRQRKALEEQNKTLKQQLEELKTIEKKLNDRQTSSEPIEINPGSVEIDNE